MKQMEKFKNKETDFEVEDNIEAYRNEGSSDGSRFRYGSRYEGDMEADSDTDNVDCDEDGSGWGKNSTKTHQNRKFNYTMFLPQFNYTTLKN